MPILKPIDGDYACTSGDSLDGILKNIFDYNGLTYIEIDAAGSQLQDLDAFAFFAVNRVIGLRPTHSENKYSDVDITGLLTFAKPTNPAVEVESVNYRAGQFEEVTKELLTFEFINTLRSYFKCCDLDFRITNITPIWNSNRAVPAVNHSGVEINYTLKLWKY